MKKTASILLLILASACIISTTAQTTPQIETLQRQRKALQEEIAITNKLFLDIKKEANAVVQRVNLITRQINARKKMVTVQQSEIAAIDRQIANTEKEIAALQRELKKKQDSYAKAINGMLRNNISDNKLFFVLSGKTLGESIRRMQYLKQYSTWQRTQAEEIKEQNRRLTDKRELLAKSKSEKQEALSSLRDEQAKLQDEEKVRQSEVNKVQGRQKELQKILQDKQKQADKLNSRIEQLIAEEVARQERERIAREKAAEDERKRIAQKQGKDSKGKQPSQTKPTETAPKKDVILAAAETLSKDFASNRGKLPMPVTGSAAIVGNFGVNKHREWNVSTNSNGVDIQTQRDADVRAVFEGEVSKVFSFPGSNTCVIVRHGNYYTFYANIRELYVKQGDKVKTGQALGKIFTDPDTGISTMHFQLWQNTNKLDPTPWLRR